MFGLRVDRFGLSVVEKWSFRDLHCVCSSSKRLKDQRESAHVLVLIRPVIGNDA